MSEAFGGVYRGRRVLVTGHTGFKGAWLSLWLYELGAEVFGYALQPPTDPNLFELIRGAVFSSEEHDQRGDIRDLATLESAIERVRPEVIFHLAAQSLVRESYADPLGTFQTNALGTANLLEVVRRRSQPCVVVAVTTDKCYENQEWEFSYRENDPLGGHDVYSMSKAAAELVASAWRRSFLQKHGLVRLATARAGNVIGGGDYARDRIVPDSIFALSRGERIPVRNPRATRPWQHVLECLSGYLCLAAGLLTAEKSARLEELQSAFNFGPGAASNRTVEELVTELLKHWPGGEWDDKQSANAPHEAGRLNLAIDKAAAVLSWFPVWEFNETIYRTVEWYHAANGKTLRDADDVLTLTRTQLRAYAEAARAKQIRWTRA